MANEKSNQEAPLTRLDIIRMGMKRARSVNEGKNGRPYGVDSAEELESLFDEYVSTIQRAPVFVQSRKRKEDADGRTLENREEKMDRPLTEAGFCLFCGHPAAWLAMMTETLRAKTRNEAEDELLTSATRIHDALRQDLINGALLGQYQSNFTARLLGLADRQQVQQEQRQIVVSNEQEKEKLESLLKSDL